MMLHSGLVSVTFRNLSPREIVDLVVKAGLECIEWGGDAHVPHGDLHKAREIARMTRDNGCKISSYGSYYIVGHENDTQFGKILETAVELGAPIVRVWAGNLASRDADEAYRGMIAERTREIADLGRNAGISISFEFHSDSLTDTNESAESLLRQVGHPNVWNHWQPSLGMSTSECLEGLRAVLCKLCIVHAFHWHPRTMERLPLSVGYDIWRQYLDVIASTGSDYCVMLEFVRNDDPNSFLQDAATLKRWFASCSHNSK